MEEVRTINRKGQPVFIIKFNGMEFRRYPSGKHPNYYYHKWKKDGVQHTELLHHAIYEKAYGKIPDGMVIHHKDFNPLNNDLGNLVMLSTSEHMRIHNQVGKWTKEHPEEFRKRCYSKDNWDERRKKVLENLRNERRVCRWCGKEFTPTNTHQRFCGKQCHHRWQYKASENNVLMVCQYCGKAFEGNKYLKPKCCCVECANKLSLLNRNTGDRRRVV